MNAAEFRCPLLSFCSRSGNATEPPLRVLAGKLGEMPINEPLIDPRFDVWVVRLGLNFLNDATQFKSITARDWFEQRRPPKHLGISAAHRREDLPK